MDVPTTFPVIGLLLSSLLWGINLQLNREPGTVYVFSFIVNVNWWFIVKTYKQLTIWNLSFINPVAGTKALGYFLILLTPIIVGIYARAASVFVRNRENQDKKKGNEVEQLKKFWAKLFGKKEANQLYFTLGKKVEE
jgi:hypothetical protein